MDTQPKQDSAPNANVAPAPSGRSWVKHIIARNPFFPISAGLLLYGINQLSTEPKLVGAEFSMLRFNFCALVGYEMMLILTAVALSRRKIWYDALLLIGLSNVLIIVPFSLISRAVFLNSNLALAMAVGGSVLTVGKFFVFKRYINGLQLPARLLALGAALLFLNAAAPLKFKGIAENSTQITAWLNVIWLFLLPCFAALAVFLPKSGDAAGEPGGKRWLPMTFYLGWITVTACHFGGIGYSLSFDWNFALLTPVLWVAAWAISLGRTAFSSCLSKSTEQSLLIIPLVLPLLAAGFKSVLPVLALLNLIAYSARFIWIERNRLALIRLLGAAAILLSGIPASWFDHFAPGFSRAAWIAACIAVCFFWLIFLSRDPRVAIAAGLGLILLSVCLAQEFLLLGLHIALVSLLAHSIRWEDSLHKGAAVLRTCAGAFWMVLAIGWLKESPHNARLPVYLGAVALLIFHVIYALVLHRGRPWIVLLFAAMVLLSEPGARLARDFTDTSPGFLAIGGSFLLFALGTKVAFSKVKAHS